MVSKSRNGEFKPTECLQYIKNLFASPKYTELKIGLKAYIKLMSYCHLAGDFEITGIGRIKDGWIVDFKIPTQVVTGTTANATDDAMIGLLREIPIDEIPEWELDWHSHVDMQAFMSGTDADNYAEMSRAKQYQQYPLLIINKKGQTFCKNYFCEDKMTDIKFTLDKSEPITDQEIEMIYNECKKDIINKCSERIVKTTTYKPTYNYGRQNDFWGSDRGYYGSYNKKKDTQENEIDDKYWWEDYDDTDDDKGYYKCQSCGTNLLSSQEIENGLCDDCLEAWIGTSK